MNNNSLICKYINEHKDTWREDFDKLKILHNSKGKFTIFNYGIKADFSNPLVQEARGIIIDDELNVVCWPFNKFFMYDDPNAAQIDWESSYSTFKMDGSIIKLWYDHDSKFWMWSTNSMITPTEEFCELIRDAKNIDDIDKSILDKNCTYIFELVSPKFQIVVKYPTTMLYHIGTRNNITGEESYEDIGVQKPEQILKDCGPDINLDTYLKFVRGILDDISIDGVPVPFEGIVVCDKNFNRIKIKTDKYMRVHNLFDKIPSKKKCLSMLISDKATFDLLVKVYPNIAHIFKYYEYKYYELIYKINKFVVFAEKLYDEYDHNNKILIDKIKYHPYSKHAFDKIFKGISVEDSLKATLPTKIYRLIKDYDENNN